MKPKPGYKTSEFWFTLVSFIFSGLFLLGFIGDPSQKDELIRDVSHGVESIILIGGQLLILYNYISTRKIAKENTIIKVEKETETNEPKPRKPRKPRSTTKSNKSRSSKTRNRKTNNSNKKLGE